MISISVIWSKLKDDIGFLFRLLRYFLDPDTDLSRSLTTKEVIGLLWYPANVLIVLSDWMRLS